MHARACLTVRFTFFLRGLAEGLAGPPAVALAEVGAAVVFSGVVAMKNGSEGDYVFVRVVRPESPVFFLPRLVRALRRDDCPRTGSFLR